MKIVLGLSELFSMCVAMYAGITGDYAAASFFMALAIYQRTLRKLP